MSPEPRRLHPAGIALEILKAAREVLVPLVVVILIGSSGGGFPTALAAVGVLVAAGGGWLRWRSTTYRLRDQTLILRTGIFSPGETSVPLSRISSVDTEQGPIQRLFGVLEVLVQTAGGGAEPEITLGAVAREEVDALRAALGHPETTRDEPPAALRRLSGGQLLVAALTAPQLGVLVPVVAGVGAVADDLVGERVDGDLLDLLPRAPGALALLALAVVAGTLAVSVLGAVVAFSGFTVERDGQRLRIRRGLLQRRAVSIPLARVHAVRVVEGVLRRPFGLASLRVETVGHRQEPAAVRTLFPLLPAGHAADLIAELVPALTAPLAPLEPPPRRALRRYLAPPLALGALAGAVPAAVGAWWALPVLSALGALEGVGRFRAAGWRLGDGRLVLRSRMLARHTLVARAARLQEHALSQSPLQRRAGLADLAVAVGSGRRQRVAHLEESVAREVFERLRAARRA
ncbi:MAG TPA: PH domain-containing protein [Solirubrobacteraceae bacterium]|nr:PH domain-containing protein [Solirubrobacteraceae bacterium]